MEASPFSIPFEPEEAVIHNGLSTEPLLLGAWGYRWARRELKTAGGVHSLKSPMGVGSKQV